MPQSTNIVVWCCTVNSECVTVVNTKPCLKTSSEKRKACISLIGIVYPIITIVSSFIDPHVVPMENWEMCLHASEAFKIQKHHENVYSIWHKSVNMNCLKQYDYFAWRTINKYKLFNILTKMKCLQIENGCYSHQCVKDVNNFSQ